MQKVVFLYVCLLGCICKILFRSALYGGSFLLPVWKVLITEQEFNALQIKAHVHSVTHFTD